MFVGLITPVLAAEQLDGKYYVEDVNEDEVVWKLNLEVANKEVSARVSYEEYGPCAYEKEGDIECGSTKLDTEGEFELWCGGQKLVGDLREASLWPATSLKDRSGGAEFEIISNSELAKFNRYNVAALMG